MKEIEDAVPPCTFRYAEKRSCSKLEEATTSLSVHDRASLAEVAMCKQRRIKEQERGIFADPHPPAQPAFNGHFFEIVPEDCQRQCSSDFIDATGSQALARASCTVCAGTFFVSDVEQMLVTNLQKMNKLTPAKTHAAQVLTEGMLLHCGPLAFTTDCESGLRANVCLSCTTCFEMNKLRRYLSQTACG